MAVANDRVASARVEVEAAQEASTAAAELLAERTANVSTARRRYEKLLESVDVAEQALNAADQQLEAAEQVSQEAADRLDAAASDLDLAESDLARLNATRPQP